MAHPRRPNYWDYIKVEELLALQGGIEPDDSSLSNDEVRFIVIHQIDELWFKLALRELTAARDLFRGDHVPETALSATVTALKRVALIFELAGSHFRLMETMRPKEYLRFRDKLSPASGFQSAQMRELEILLGLDEHERIRYGNEASFKDALKGDQGTASPALQRVILRIADRPSLKDAIYAWLFRTPIHGSMPGRPGDEETVQSFLAEFLVGHEHGMRVAVDHLAKAQALTPDDELRLAQRYRQQLAQAKAFLQAEDVTDPGERPRARRLRAAAIYIESHRELPLLAWPCEILDAIVEMEQSMIVFRQRHARMVERVIGRRVGTGGSDGVAYLDQTALQYRVFKELWATRTLLLQPDLLPQPHNPEFYDFRAQP